MNGGASSALQLTFVSFVSFCLNLGSELAVKTRYLFSADGAVFT